jgi:hypothetical protein
LEKIKKKKKKKVMSLSLVVDLRKGGSVRETRRVMETSCVGLGGVLPF